MRFTPFLFASVTLLALPAAADWPLARHDAARTAAATGKGDLTKPSTFWRSYLGGTLRADAMTAFDVDGDGTSDLLFAAGGRVTAKRPNDEVLWRTPQLEISALIGVVDVNGDGQQDLITSTGGRVVILSAKTGAIEWAQPVGEMGAIGGIRVGDLNGDKRPDIYIQACNCCAVTGTKTTVAYSFAEGFAAPKSLWSIGTLYCGSSRALALADSDGDGQPEVVTGDDTSISLLSGASGAEVAKSGPLGAYVGWAFCHPADIDGVKGDELVCLQSFVGALPSAREVFVLKRDGAATPSLKQLWTKTIGDVDGALQAPPSFVSDLDGDGLVELVVTGRVGMAQRTSILDAKTGAELATITDARATGTVPTKDSKVVLLANRDSKLIAFSFDRKASPSVTQKWEAADSLPVSTTDALSPSTFTGRTLSLDSNGDGSPEVITFTGSPPSGVELRDSATGALVATYKAPAQTSLTAVIRHPGTTGFTPVTVARTDGTMSVLDASLKVTNEAGVRFGGYRAPGNWRNLETSPVVGKLEAGGYDQVLVPDSRGGLLRLDAKGATNLVGPKTVWRRASTNAPAIIENLDGGKPGIACRALQLPLTTPAKHEIVALKADGTPLFTRPVDGEVFGDVVPAKLNADGVPDLVFQWGVASDLLLHTRALNGASGALLWNSTPIDPGAGRQPAGFSVTDWNKDGTDDVVFQGAGTRVLDGANGTQIAAGGPTDPYFLTTPFDVDGDGSAEVILHGGFTQARMLKHNLTDSVWASPTTDKPFPYGAVAQCAAKGPVFVEGSWGNPARLRLIPMTGASAGVPTFTVLAGGKAYPDEAAATAAGVAMGQLSNANVHANLSGTGKAVAVVGSTDGWLYAIDPCDATVVFAHQLGAPVGEAVFGDTDGDGLDEIVVSVADGYLYGLKQGPIPAPEFVWDTNGPASGADIDTTTNTSSLSAKWAAVPMADSYELAAAGPGVTTVWKNVGNVTEATLGGLSLTAGAQYTVGVRAVTGTRTSADTVSDGVVVVTGGDAGPGDAGSDASGSDASSDADLPPAVEGGGCNCDIPARGRFPSSLVALAISAALLSRRRTR